MTSAQTYRWCCMNLPPYAGVTADCQRLGIARYIANAVPPYYLGQALLDVMNADAEKPSEESRPGPARKPNHGGVQCLDAPSGGDYQTNRAAALHDLDHGRYGQRKRSGCTGDSRLKQPLSAPDGRGELRRSPRQSRSKPSFLDTPKALSPVQ